jgi:hypothetical protein
VRLLRATVVSGLVANPGVTSNETGIGVNMQGNQMPTMADLGAHRGGTESVKQQGGRIGSELRTLQALLRPVSFSLSMLNHHS